MRIISDKGFYALFRERYVEISLFYSVFEYFIFIFFQIPPVILETFLPIIMGVCITLLNYLVIKEIYHSSILELLVLISSIFSLNTMRLVTDLHRNLFSLILVQISLFIILPKYLRVPRKKESTILILALVLTGFSQIESFFMVEATLICLFLHSLLVKSFKRAESLFLITFTSSLLFVLMASPLLNRLYSHMFFNPERSPQPARMEDYLKFLGGPSIPFYLIGFLISMLSYKKKHEDVYLILFVWNTVLISVSFLPFFGVIIPGWRSLLLTTVPVITTIGLTLLSRLEIHVIVNGGSRTCKVLSSKVLMVLVLIALTCGFLPTYYAYSISIFRPWISNEMYQKLIWISTLERTQPSIFVMYFNLGGYTWSILQMYKEWIRAVLGSDTGVYFGRVESLLLRLPTPCSDKETNLMSYRLWDYVSSLNIEESDIYVIDDWYPVANEKIFVEIHPGIYKVFKPVKETSMFYPARDYYNCTRNAYGREVEWSPRIILEVYEHPTKTIKIPTYFQVTYLVPMSDEVSYTLRIRLLDHYSGSAPITIKLDGKYITSLTYNSTYLPKIIEVPLPYVEFGFHLVSLEIIGHLDKVHVITLDYIEFIPSVERGA